MSDAGHCGRTQVERRRIGRVKGAGNNVCVKDPSVSQKHAELVWSGAAWQLTDLGSSNGTFVNGKELQEGGAFWVESAGGALWCTAERSSSCIRVLLNAQCLWSCMTATTCCLAKPAL